jgi:HAE1 family hydrophobic/amphiphilic exporter-1
MRGLTSDIPGAGVSVIQAPLIRAGSGRGSLAVQIRGEELERIQALASELEKRLKEVPGVLFVNPSFELGKPEYVVDVNRVRAAELGLSVQDVGSVVEAVVYGTLTGRYDNAGREIDLRVRAPAGSIQSARDVERAVIYTPNGRTVQLGDIAAIRAERGPTEIQHVDMYRSASLWVGPDDQVPLGEMVQRLDAVLAEVRKGLPLGYSLRVAGQADDLQRMLEAFRPSMLLAMLITFLLLASLFESFVIPAVIFVSVPFAISGGLLGLFLLRLVDPTLQLDTMTMLGFVILLGVVVNNAILVVHQGLNELAQGGDPNEALLSATGSRVRPILMTLVTTVFGMSPLVIFSGSGSELYRGLGAVLLGGLVVSTAFTLVLTPAVMSLVLDWLPRESVAAVPAES